MPLLNADVARRLALAATTIAVLPPPALAHAQTPGSLAQLASPNDCIESTTNARLSSTTPGLSGTKDVAITSDGKNVYVISQSDESIAEFARNADGSLSPIGCIVELNDSSSSCSGPTTAVGLAIRGPSRSARGQQRVRRGRQQRQWRRRRVRTERRRHANPARPADCIAESQEAVSECGADRAFGLKSPSAIAVRPDGQNVYVTDEE